MNKYHKSNIKLYKRVPWYTSHINPWGVIAGQRKGENKIIETNVEDNLYNKIIETKALVNYYKEIGSTFRLLSYVEKLIPLLIEDIMKKHC